MQRRVGPFGRHVVLPVGLARTGGPGPTPSSARGPRWRRTSHGFYVPAGTPITPEQRVAEASVLVPRRGALTGWAALRWQGGRWFDGTTDGGRSELPVTIVSPGADLRGQAGIRVCRSPLAPGDTTTYDGVRVTAPAAAAVAEMRHATSLVEAVVVADMAAYSDLASLAEIGEVLDSHPGATGNTRSRRALGLAHENSWSPMETRLRLLWQLTAGLPPLLVNCPVLDLEGRHVATPDLLDVEAGLVIEYDGAEHHGGVRRLGDNRREDDLRDAGLAYLCVLGGEMHHPRRLAERLRRARVRAGSGGGERRWTTRLPSWWRHPGDTVDSRRRKGR